ncbi:MAG: ABC transporter permease [Chloroflexi bacterium]|nr:ABC transporter permease [Chloroflexota bacterium]
MNRYIIRSVLIALPTILGISFVIFAVLSLAPNDPMSQFALNPAIPFEVRENIRRSYGLDQPWPIRYVKWLGTLVTTGDLGYSFGSKLPVTTLILQRLPATLWVLGVSYIISVILALPIGIISAVKQYSIFDNLVSTFAFVGFSVPTFVTGYLLILLLSVRLHWLPFIYDSTLVVKDLESFGQLLRQSAMPIMVLGLFETATLARYTRASMLENLPLDYVRTARAKGINEWQVISRHAFRNSMIPVVTLIALGVPGIFGGALITEQIFRVPGIGSLLIHSLEASDTPVIMGVTFVFGVLVVLFNLIADIIYGFLDPRIKYT